MPSCPLTESESFQKVECVARCLGHDKLSSLENFENTSRQYGGYRRHKKKLLFFNFHIQNVNEYDVLTQNLFVAG